MATRVPIQTAQTLIQPLSCLIMLYMKFDQNWPTDFRHTTLKLWTEDGRRMPDHCHTKTSLEPSAQVC